MTLVLITTKQSNIIEDFEVLRQLNQVGVQLCNSSKSNFPLISLDIDEKTIISKSFDMILSFDDVVSLECRESVTMPQLEAYLEIDSTDEKNI